MRGMNSGKTVGFLLLLSAVVGCTTIFNAQMAQESVADKGEGICPESPLPKLDLAGYSLHELVDFALTNRPSMASAALAVVDARLALKEIEAGAPLVSYAPWMSPHFGLSGNYSESSTPAKSLKWRTDGNVSAGLSLDILVYDFGRNVPRKRRNVPRKYVNGQTQ